MTVLLYAMIGIFQNRFSYLWGPTSECLSVLISKHVGTLWDKFIRYFEDWQTSFLSSNNLPKEVIDNSSEKSSGKSSTLSNCFYHHIFKFVMVQNNVFYDYVSLYGAVHMFPDVNSKFHRADETLQFICQSCIGEHTARFIVVIIDPDIAKDSFNL